jgi:hypothetical protein
MTGVASNATVPHLILDNSGMHKDPGDPPVREPSSRWIVVLVSLTTLTTEECQHCLQTCQPLLSMAPRDTEDVVRPFAVRTYVQGVPFPVLAAMIV